MTVTPSVAGTPGRPPRWQRYVAIGDSFTEGLCDPEPGGSPHLSGGPWRGWADRLAALLADGARTGRRVAAPAGEAPEPGIRYANLAVRGRLLHDIVGGQLPAALELRPDLVSLVGGTNDILRPGADPDRLAGQLDDAVARLRAGGADVLLATGADPRRSPLLRRTRGTVAVFASNTWALARRHQAYLVDLWGMTALADRRMWAPDRIHLSSEGHRRVALAAAETLGLDLRALGADPGWAVPLPPEPGRPRVAVLSEDLAWAARFVLPWATRRLRRRSSGAELAAKRPTLGPVR